MRSLARTLAALLPTAFLFTGCGPADGPANEAGAPEQPSAAAGADSVSLEIDPRPVMIWAQTGSLERRNVLREQVHRFNTMQNEIQVDIRFVPSESYDDEVQAAALADKLPDLIEFDAPHLYKYIAADHLLPLDDLLPGVIRDDLLPSIVEQGTYEDRLYSVGASDVGIGLYLNPAKFLNLNIRFPRSTRTAWTAEEFDDLLAQLYEESGGEPVLDLKANYNADWFAYALAPPVLASAGAGLLDPESFQRADGVVNSREAVRAMTLVQSWFQKGYIDPNEDDEAFTSGRVGLSWSGHWEQPRYDQALNGAFILVPLPDFGTGSRTAHGDWSWAIPRQARHPDASMTFLEYMLQPAQLVELTNVSRAIPARRSVIGLTSHYGEEMVLNRLARQLQEGSFATRPQTPALPEILQAFEEAWGEISNGADVQKSLDLMAATIDRSIAEKVAGTGSK